MTRVLKAGVLGATGTVGQRFILLLSEHPGFSIHTLGASPRSAGKPYNKATKWKMSQPIPASVRDMVVQTCEPLKEFLECDVVFSGLDADVAGDIEMAFLKADLALFSNAKNYRTNEDVPLIVPLVNSSHFDLLAHQRNKHQLKKGFLVTNANCSTSGLVVPLKALQDAFGPLSKIIVTTMQAVSGAGYPGVPSLDILDNVVPYIGGEEPKMEWETLKILGGLNQDATAFDLLKTTKVSATCNRVPVLDGHTECVSIEFERRPAPSVEEVIQVLENYRSEAQELGCHSAPDQAIIVSREDDRPQPRLDRENGKGYSVTVGRVRPCNVFDIKFTLLAHNTILGAAGSGVLLAELAQKKGLIA
ncbi:aspartate-semialdehyde dehydrogenase [Lobosporangium transversale]|uniref:Aspartate-semialdehyde dehydrogenase n=1 Tax=Lobosporangium transversale TaxID=64571 RepID=A0A1Y2H2W9_9FUNG|nr:aspartate-semialdehyde dehydrogenase [Lobosporangium transversale]ORZ28897.1 aspartate-semialdehyde dehydrogenase [Lobosporangium transversale]|eukprot:XP_021886570.1 aspartate-semialdehyde dehydrogenase [Lobosporangium transversale]